MGILSFNGNKIITTGGGGAILTNNKKLYKFSKHIASTAKKNLVLNMIMIELLGIILCLV